MKLANRVVWVTGSARRVGRAIALECAREGADVVVHCHRSREEADGVAAEIQALGRRTLVVQGDHGQPADVTRMVAEIEGHFGRLDALVNSAAGYPLKPFEEIGEEDFFAIMRTNAYGPFLCTQKALPLLRKAAPGRVVNITDWALVRPYKGRAHYNASKGALNSITLALARELAPGVLVNAVAPGPVLEPENLSPTERAAIIARTTLKRWGTPDDVARAVVYLLESDYLCGETIVVDGGLRLG